MLESLARHASRAAECMAADKVSIISLLVVVLDAETPALV